MQLFRYFLSGILTLMASQLYAQQIELYQQFNGKYDYTAIGNTLNLVENGSNTDCDILTSSSANLSLDSSQQIVAAYLYWAGSGPGDFNVTLNQAPISAQRTFSHIFNSGGTDYLYFSAFADVTQQLINTGNGNYTLADLDLTQIIVNYCQPIGTATNFGGWSITVIYEDASLPVNQVTIFDGLESVSSQNTSLNITLENLNVVDTNGAKIGFLAWEGDSSIANNESLRINGNLLSNPPLNPSDNVFNSTNSYTGSNTLYNMDMDFYTISNFINTGDTSATIQLTSEQDFVMINNIVTVLNTELPDATITIDDTIGGTECGNREIEVDYTIYNLNSTAILPAATPISFYANETLVGQSQTVADIAIGGEESGSIILNIPLSVGADFILKAIADDTGNGSGVVSEIDEGNNEDEIPFHLLEFPVITGLQNLETCDVFGIESFDLTEATSQIDPIYNIDYYTSQEDAEAQENPITDPENFINTENPQTIYIRVSNPDCFIIDSFTVEVIFCPLPDATVEIPQITACRGRALSLPFTVFNLIEATGPLPAGTQISFYSEGLFLGISQTQSSIEPGESEIGNVNLIIPDNFPETFSITAVVDDNGNGIGSVEEIREDNNTYTEVFTFESIPPLPNLPNLLRCDEGFDTATFDLTSQNDLITNNSDEIINYYTSEEDALALTNAIENPSAYENIEDPQTIFVRLDTEICFAITSFLIETENCKPIIPQGFSPNGDGINDNFEITNLLDIYENFELKIFSREGNLIHTGHNSDGFWGGIATEGLLFTGNIVPTGTYYYILFLNDPKYPEPFVGWVYINY
ncbi:T9SS type B sorting domain-containing protein [Aequorivita echinoideorum]|uniref:Gliding motility-associated C-terminal domain-containing protein n=1 Tax=Aequorivita echinoideorum TaxID=1549647 RepID=A0ABS5S7T3_9FLAO|nr:gliding motility-associated C-terminal domain-containing protein [Aequorivita echinoideorum]MBT0609048.1 gliding motility-associated C-terminal domain-containing protein [Aequorivita echinoideorum]